MRSALFPLSIQGGCCRSREPTVWGQVIAWSVYARRASRIDPANLLQTVSRSAIAEAILRPGACWLKPQLSRFKNTIGTIHTGIIITMDTGIIKEDIGHTGMVGMFSSLSISSGIRR